MRVSGDLKTRRVPSSKALGHPSLNHRMSGVLQVSRSCLSRSISHPMGSLESQSLPYTSQSRSHMNTKTGLLTHMTSSINPRHKLTVVRRNSSPSTKRDNHFNTATSYKDHKLTAKTARNTQTQCCSPSQPSN